MLNKLENFKREYKETYGQDISITIMTSLNNDTHIHYICKNNLFNDLETELENNVNEVRKYMKIRNCHGYTPFNLACLESTECAKLLLKYNLIDKEILKICDLKKNNPLHIAYYKNSEIAMDILDLKCCDGDIIDDKNSDGVTPIIIAAKKASTEIVKHLINIGKINRAQVNYITNSNTYQPRTYTRNSKPSKIIKTTFRSEIMKRDDFTQFTGSLIKNNLLVKENFDYETYIHIFRNDLEYFDKFIDMFGISDYVLEMFAKYMSSEPYIKDIRSIILRLIENGKFYELGKNSNDFSMINLVIKSCSYNKEILNKFYDFCRDKKLSYLDISNNYEHSSQELKLNSKFTLEDYLKLEEITNNEIAQIYTSGFGEFLFRVTNDDLLFYLLERCDYRTTTYTDNNHGYFYFNKSADTMVKFMNSKLAKARIINRLFFTKNNNLICGIGNYYRSSECINDIEMLSKLIKIKKFRKYFDKYMESCNEISIHIINNLYKSTYNDKTELFNILNSKLTLCKELTSIGKFLHYLNRTLVSNRSYDKKFIEPSVELVRKLLPREKIYKTLDDCRNQSYCPFKYCFINKKVVPCDEIIKLLYNSDLLTEAVFKYNNLLHLISNNSPKHFDMFFHHKNCTDEVKNNIYNRHCCIFPLNDKYLRDVYLAYDFIIDDDDEIDQDIIDRYKKIKTKEEIMKTRNHVISKAKIIDNWMYKMYKKIDHNSL